MERIRQLRQERDLSQAKLAVMAGMDPATLNRLEQGKGNPSLRTLRQVADVLGVDVADLLETDSPKGQAPPPPEKHQLSGVSGALENYMRRRGEEHGREVKDPESPYFRNATTAALWVESVSKEIRMWAEWVLDHMETLTPPAEGWLDMQAWDNAFKLVGHRLTFNRVIRFAETRIAEMADKPDELTLKRMERAQAETRESFQRLEERRRSASG